MELYDHQSDPGENINIAGEADPALIDQLQGQLHAGWEAAQPR